MSTTYGSVTLRDGTKLEIEAFGISGSVKLIPVDMALVPEGGFAIDDPAQIDLLITLLEIARDHVWQDSP
jgi:hypothetical protein